MLDNILNDYKPVLILGGPRIWTSGHFQTWKVNIPCGIELIKEKEKPEDYFAQADSSSLCYLVLEQSQLRRRGWSTISAQAA